MSIQAVMIIGMILITILGCAAFINWREVFEKIWGNNPTKAKVYVEAGEQITICKGVQFGDSSRGVVYRYQYFKIWQSVIVPLDYPYRYVLGRRQIRVLVGQPEAAPLGDFVTSSLPVSSGTLDAIFRANIGLQLAKTIFGKSANYMKMIIVVAIVIVAGYFLYQNMMPKQVPGQVPGIEEPLLPAPDRPIG